MGNSLAKVANPAPLGLFGFALTTLLLNIHNAGFFGISVMIIAMGIFYGGIAQIIVGIMEWKQGNTFGMVAFLSYGSFWLTLAFIWVAPHFGLPAADPISMAWYLAVWGVFSAVLFFCALYGHLAGKLVFGTLIILFALLSLANFTQNHMLHVAAGYSGILCACCAFYEASAILINEKAGRQLLPLG